MIVHERWLDSRVLSGWRLGQLRKGVVVCELFQFVLFAICFCALRAINFDRQLFLSSLAIIGSCYLQAYQRGAHSRQVSTCAVHAAHQVRG